MYYASAACRMLHPAQKEPPPDQDPPHRLLRAPFGASSVPRPGEATKHSMDLADLTSAQKIDIEHLAAPGGEMTGNRGRGRDEG